MYQISYLPHNNALSTSKAISVSKTVGVKERQRKQRQEDFRKRDKVLVSEEHFKMYFKDSCHPCSLCSNCRYWMVIREVVH